MFTFQFLKFLDYIYSDLMYHIATYSFGSERGIKGDIGKEETWTITSLGYRALFYRMLIFLTPTLL